MAAFAAALILGGQRVGKVGAGRRFQPLLFILGAGTWTKNGEQDG